MEGVSNSEAFGDLKFETNRIQFRNYGIWTNESWSKLQGRHSKLDVPSGEPNFVPWLKRRWLTPVAVSKAFEFVGSCPEGIMNVTPDRIEGLLS